MCVGHRATRNVVGEPLASQIVALPRVPEDGLVKLTHSKVQGIFGLRGGYISDTNEIVSSLQAPPEKLHSRAPPSNDLVCGVDGIRPTLLDKAVEFAHGLAHDLRGGKHHATTTIVCDEESGQSRIRRCQGRNAGPAPSLPYLRLEKRIQEGLGSIGSRTKACPFGLAQGLPQQEGSSQGLSHRRATGQNPQGSIGSPRSLAEAKPVLIARGCITTQPAGNGCCHSNTNWPKAQLCCCQTLDRPTTAGLTRASEARGEGC
mmetsp:Transcript_139322/g.445480  ORF Transcript_139322/g.445480 Transcript_139322/m.445480 type:complete len:260 (-) Transcript_139322:187-966(-)